jgi:hypothetical protein
MRCYSLLLILGCTWLIGGCRTLATPSPSIPITVQATKPAQPSVTATLFPSQTATVTPTEIPETPTATSDIASTVVALTSPRIHSFFASADQKWRVEVVVHDCVKVHPGENADANAVEMLKLIQISNQTEKIIETQLLNCGGVGAGGLGGLFWSPSSQYFYYTDAREGLPDGICGYWARPIKRVNVNTQKVELVGAGHLSPDKTKLAFWQDNEIVIWSLDEGEIARVPATRSEAFKNQIAWSPDSQSLIYLQTELDCYPFGKSYVTRLDLSGLTQTLLLELETPSFSWLTWDAPYRISLVDDQGNQWRYNLVSKELRRVP